MAPSAPDILNEQLQLSLEIANLQLLLEGAVSDRFVAGTHLLKHRVTLGFPVSVSPQKARKDEVAIVEVTVTDPAWTQGNEAPSVTVLLPREKTYNVANITEKSTSIGGGIVTQVLSAGVSALWGRKTFYVVQDQDTVAGLKSDPAGKAAVFQWQFRPVLGREVVREGLRQVFVQLALPVLEAQGCQANVNVRTYWLKYDRKKGLLKQLVPDSEVSTSPMQSVRRYDLQPQIDRVAWEDAGDGSVVVRVDGRFMSGTYVRIGNLILTPGPAGITFEETGIRFVVKAVDCN